jgi:hypothetical protein
VERKTSGETTEKGKEIKDTKEMGWIATMCNNFSASLFKGLDIRSISELYEVHCTSHARTRLLDDILVNHCRTSKANRESEYVRKHSVTLRAEQEYERALRMNTH